jgi:serine/threonine protein phosphatase PrpC
MSYAKDYIKKLFEREQIIIGKNKADLFSQFMADEATTTAIAQIQNIQKQLMDRWKLTNRLNDIQQQPIMIPNSTVGKPYQAKLDFIKWGWDDIIYYELEGLDGLGLQYNDETELIIGTPIQSGEIKLILKFRLNGEAEDSPLHEKKINLVINPDPKSLWKKIDSNREALYWKEDEVAIFDKIGNRHIVAASKRGRSHANVGSFRDDDFRYKHYDASGWNIVVVADGAGSARFSREGSRIACAAVIHYFGENFTEAVDGDFQNLLTTYHTDANSTAGKGISNFIYQHLIKGAYYAHQQIAETATKAEAPLKDFHTTLAFTLFKKYDTGYAFLSFAVGDCPMALLNTDLTESTMLNVLDVGEYSGGTRFLTMPEIFKSETLSTRIRFKWMSDFSYLLLMTDGIFDPKFSVEAALEKTENWKALIADLGGANDDGAKVEFTPSNTEMANQLSTWMDFWSPGNHDDRTLVIVF